MDFTSDLAVWQGQFTRKAMDLKEVYALMKQDKAVVERFLKEKGIDRRRLSPSCPLTSSRRTRRSTTTTTKGDLVDRESGLQRLPPQARVSRSPLSDIDLVERLANEVTELIEQDVYITSYPPKYYYTQLGARSRSR